MNGRYCVGIRGVFWKNGVAKMRFLSLVGTAFLRKCSNHISKHSEVVADLCLKKDCEPNVFTFSKFTSTWFSNLKNVTISYYQIWREIHHK